MEFTYSVIIPVYNSEQTLSELSLRLGEVLKILCKGRSDQDSAFEVILVNDGSKDGSWDTICRLAETYPWVRGINMMRNYGQHNALLAGLRDARNQIAITMDDDLQHPPEEIPILIEKLKEGYDVVYGIPAKMPHSFLRNIFSRATKKMLAFAMGIPTIRDIGSFRAFKTFLRDASKNYQSPNVILDVLLSWGTNKFTAVVVNEAPRSSGTSNYNLYKLFVQAMLVMTGFSTVPLRIASITGFIFTLIGIFIFLYVTIVYFTAGSVPGFPFLASIVSLFSGTQLFTLGIFGEYLARVFDRSMDRPTYVIAQWIGDTK